MSGRTLEDRVLNHIEEHRGEWFIDPSLRRLVGGVRVCPLMSLRGTTDPVDISLNATKEMRVAASADFGEQPKTASLMKFDYRAHFDPALRRRMLEKAGLTEVGGE